MLIEYLSPGLVQFHALQYLEEALRVERETHEPARRRPVRKALGRVIGYAGVLLTRVADRLEQSLAETPNLQGCG